MSGFNTLRDNAPAPPPKQMSSRLLTMKFMQRASSTNQRPNANRTPSNSQPTTPASEQASKRQKTFHTPDSSTPTTPATEPQVYASRADIKAAIQTESAFDALARAKRAELGFGHNEYETEWVLNVPAPTGAAAQDDLDEEHDSESEEEPTGRQTFGGYKRHKKTKSTTSTPASKTITPAQNRYGDFDSDDLDDDEEDSEDGEVDAEHRSRSHGESGKKRKAHTLDEDDELAMSALDRVDLSKTGYAKAKRTTPGGATNTQWGDAGKEKKNKRHGKDHSGKKKGRRR